WMGWAVETMRDLPTVTESSLGDSWPPSAPCGLAAGGRCGLGACGGDACGACACTCRLAAGASWVCEPDVCGLDGCPAGVATAARPPEAGGLGVCAPLATDRIRTATSAVRRWWKIIAA